MSVYFASLCVRLCGRGGADQRTGPLGRGGDVRDPARVEPHQRAPQAASLRLHCQRRSSPGLNTHTHCQHDKNKPLCPAYRSLTCRLQSPPRATFLRTAEYLLWVCVDTQPASFAMCLPVCALSLGKMACWTSGLGCFCPCAACVTRSTVGASSETVFCRLCNSGGRLCVCRPRLYERLFSSSAQFKCRFIATVCHCQLLHSFRGQDINFDNFRWIFFHPNTSKKETSLTKENFCSIITSAAQPLLFVCRVFVVVFILTSYISPGSFLDKL